MANGAASSEELLEIYHDLWELRLRARGMNQCFLDYLLEVALEDVNQAMAIRPLIHQPHL